MRMEQLVDHNERFYRIDIKMLHDFSAAGHHQYTIDAVLMLMSLLGDLFHEVLRAYKKIMEFQKPGNSQRLGTELENRQKAPKSERRKEPPTAEAERNEKC